MTAPEIIPVGVSDRWPAGRPASPRSAFFQTQDGSQIGAALEALARTKRRSTQAVERLRRQGRDNSTLAALSPRQIEREKRSDTRAAAQYMKRRPGG